MAKKDCGECSRHDLFECLKKGLETLPEVGGDGWGEHDGYVNGLINGIHLHIQAVNADLKLLEKDAMQDGSLFEKED